MDPTCRRIVEAELCPVPGPCPECGAAGQHGCELGDRQRLGLSPAAAFQAAVASREYLNPRGASTREEAIRTLLGRSCKAHRQEADFLLQRLEKARVDAPRRQSEKATPFKSAPGRRRGPGVVLVVEDDVCFRRDLCELIESAGFTAVGAASGADAVRYLRVGNIRPRLILLDLNMPEMDGFDFRTWMRADRVLAAVPVVVLSAHRDLLTLAKRLEIAAALEKPVAPADVLACLEKFSA